MSQSTVFLFEAVIQYENGALCYWQRKRDTPKLSKKK